LFALGTLIVVALMVVVLLFTKTGDNTEHRRLSFAATILSGIGLIFLMSMAMFYFDGYDLATHQRTTNEVGKAIFNSCVQVLPPIVTLVLGYYFGRSRA
jgi:amino acid transporter